MKTENNLQVQQLQLPALSQKLMGCLLNLGGTAETKSSAKMDLIETTSLLMPGGKPNFAEVVRYPKISDLCVKYSRKVMLVYVTMLIKDFCASINVVRNMNEDQMIEAGAMLIDECGNFRLEDYVMMFAMAKKGELFKIFDHLDIQVITAILDEYWIRRKRSGEHVVEEHEQRLISLGNPTKTLEEINPADKKVIESVERISASFEILREQMSAPKTYEDGKV